MRYRPSAIAIWTGLAAGISLSTPTALGADDPIPRILLVGDSWTQQMWGARSVRTALSSRGLGKYEERGSRTALGGSTAMQWAGPVFLQLIADELTAYPTIDIILLCVGGNDLSAGRTTAQITQDIETVVDYVLALRTDLKVLFVGYTYFATNFGFPSYRAQNDWFAQFELARLNLAQRKDRMYYQLNLGLLQATFGFPPHFEAGEVPLPGGPPDYEPFQGGDPNFGAPPFAFVDDLHLTTAGYLAVAERAADQFLAGWLSEQDLFRRGDSNASGANEIADAVFTLSYLFAGGAVPSCLDSADANDDGTVDISDAISIIWYFFANTGPLPPPFGECGIDATIDDTGCASYPSCQ